MKYAALADAIASHTVKEYKEGVVRSGFTCWPKAMKGDWVSTRDFQEDPGKWDVLHVTVHSMNIGIVSQTRKLLSDSQTLIASLDVSPDASTSFIGANRTYNISHDLVQADLLHGAIPEQRPFLEGLCRMVRGAKVPPIAIFPHPLDVDGVRGLKRENGEPVFSDDRQKIVGTFVHKYEVNLLPSAIASRLTDQALRGHEMRPRRWALFGVEPGMTTDHRLFNALAGQFYGHILENGDYAPFIQDLAECALLTDTALTRTACRIFQDCCALGIPIVATDAAYYPKLVGYDARFPELVVDSSDPIAISNGIIRALSDMELYTKVGRFLAEKAQVFHLDSARERMHYYVKRVKDGVLGPGKWESFRAPEVPETDSVTA